MEQMEFYFGDANLAKSTFMKGLMRTNRHGSSPPGTNDNEAPQPDNDDLTGWVDLDIFAKFNKLVDMLKKGFGSDDLNILWKALNKIDSDLLEIQEVEAKDGQSHTLLLFGCCSGWEFW